MRRVLKKFACAGRSISLPLQEQYSVAINAQGQEKEQVLLPDPLVLGTGSFFTLETTTLGAGSHTVEVVVEDTTAMVLNDPAQLLSERRRWDVTVTPPDTTPALVLSLKQENRNPGDTLLVKLRAQQPGPALVVDFYFGVILPDGVTTLFITSLSPLDGRWTRLDADARTFQPMLTNIQILHKFDVTFDNFLVHTVSGAETPGVYTLIAALTSPGAFGDGRVDAGDLLGLAVKPFRVSPSGTSGPVPRFPTNVQTIRERHTTK
jgi:hypothetical protein